MSRSRAVAVEVATFLGFVLWAILATWPLGAQLTSAVPGDLGDPLEYVWLVGWGAHALTDQPLAIFDSNMYFPSELTLVFSENLLGLAVPLAPLTRLTGNPLLATNVGIIGSLAAASYGVRRLALALGAGGAAAVLAGAAFAVAPYRMSSVTHVHVLAIHWLPFALLALVRLTRRPTPARAAALAAVVAAQLWTSLTGGAMTLLAVGASVLALLITARRDAARATVLAGVAVLVGVAAAAPLLLAYRAAVDEHPAYSHPEIEEVQNSATPGAYLHPHRGGTLTAPFYAPLAESTEPAFSGHEKTLFPGLWVAFVGVAAALLPRKRRRTDPFVLVLLACIAIVGFVLSLGPRWGAREGGLLLPYGVLSSVISGLGRAPARFGLLVTLAAVLASAIALRQRPRWLVALSALVLVVEAWPPVLQPTRAPQRNLAHRSLARTERTLLVLPTLEVVGPERIPVPLSAIRETQILWFSTAHYRPMVNGYGAFVPEPYKDIAAGVQVFPSASAFELLRRLGIDTVVVETSLTPGTPWEDVTSRLAGWPGARLLRRAAGTEVWDVSLVP